MVLLCGLEILDDMVEVALVLAGFLGDPLLELADLRVGGHGIVTRKERGHVAM